MDIRQNGYKTAWILDNMDISQHGYLKAWILNSLDNNHPK